MGRISSFRSALLLLLLGLVVACGSVFNEPEVTLQTVQVGGLGIRGGTLLVSVQVINPNSFSLSADQLSYQLSVSDPEQPEDTTWIDFASGTYDQGFSVGARDTAVVQVPVEFSYAALGAAAGSIARAGTFTYRASGTVDVRTPLGTRQVPFRKRGTVALLGAQ
jgi:LEA14-like dessication related protein